MRGQALQAARNAQNGAHVARVAVRIPRAHGGDLDGTREVARAVAHSQRADAGVGDDVAHPAVAVIAPLGLQHRAAGAPVIGIGAVESAHSFHHGGIDALPRNLCKARIHDGVDVGRFKRLGDACGNKGRAVEALAVVADGGGGPGVPCRPRRVGGRHQAPGINENLAADLLGQSLAVLADAAGLRGGHAVFQIEVGRVLGADAVSAPPVQANALARVVEPGLRYSLRRGLAGMIVQRAQKKHRAVGVVVGGKMLVVLHIAADIAVGIADAFVAPQGGLHRRSQADADVHAQKARVDFLYIRHGFQGHTASFAEKRGTGKAPFPLKSWVIAARS